MRSAALLLHTMLSVTSINCDQWERLDRQTWRAESYAKVDVEDGYLMLWRVDVTKDSAPDVFDWLIWQCDCSMDGGLAC